MHTHHHEECVQMFRIDNFKDTDNPEQSSRQSNCFERPSIPSETDKKRLERPEVPNAKYSYTPEKSDSPKEKLSEKPSYSYHWDGKPTHNTEWDSPASPATKQKVLSRW